MFMVVVEGDVSVFAPVEGATFWQPANNRILAETSRLINLFMLG
jgi:hypothetical protein